MAYLDDNLPPGCSDADIDRPYKHSKQFCHECNESVSWDDWDEDAVLCASCAKQHQNETRCSCCGRWIPISDTDECPDCELAHEDELRNKS